ncbi:MAG: hypothetical protein N2645_09070 [Clostridia bacterium]|nr:hypothetical protein [Clostridia bacterium]
MNSFYLSIMTLGILLVLISLALVFYDRKRAIDHASLIDEKKVALEGLMKEAEEMIEELNKFSDYIVTQIDSKNDEVCKMMETLENRIQQVNTKINEEKGVKKLKGEKNTVIGNANILARAEETKRTAAGNPLPATQAENLRIQTKARDKVIPINSRYKEVIQLAESGVDETEIAKMLNMGKGEIELILGMNKII